MKALHSLGVVDLGGEDISVAVDREVVHPVELTGLPARAAERAEQGAVRAAENADLVVLAVGVEQQGLTGIRPEREVPYAARAEGLRRNLPLGHKTAILAEDLDAVVLPVAHIDEPVLRELHAVHGRAELARRRLLWVIALGGVGGAAAIGAPVSLVGAGIGVEDDDAAVAVAVGDVDLVGRRIDRDIGWAAQPRHVVARGTVRGVANLQHEAAVAGEFQHLPIIGAVAADPDEAFRIDIDAVLALEPVVALARAAPRAQHVAGRIELDHRWRRDAADAARRVQRGALLVGGQAAGALDDPDIVRGVDRNAGDLAENPVVRQRFRPERVHLHARRLGRRRRGCEQAGCENCEQTADIHLTPSVVFQSWNTSMSSPSG